MEIFFLAKRFKQRDVLVTHDSYINRLDPVVNYNGLNLVYRFDAPNANQVILLKITDGEPVWTPSAIKLHVYCLSLVGNQHFAVSPIFSTWGEATVTWNNQPSIPAAHSWLEDNHAVPGAWTVITMKNLILWPEFRPSRGVYLKHQPGIAGDQIITFADSEYADASKRPFFRFIP